MKIYSVFICDKNSKLILCRNYIEMSLTEINNHVSYFINNINNKINDDINLIKINKFYYNYISMNNNIFLVLISSVNNNNFIILEKFLKILFRILNGICKNNLNENEIKKNFLNIIFYFDETINNQLIINLNYAQIHNNVEMIQIDKKIKIKEQKEEKEKIKQTLIKQMNEFEKMENFKNLNNNNVNNIINNNNNNNNMNNSNNTNKKIFNGIQHNIHLNEKIEFIQIERPIKFKTPSGKVILMSEELKKQNFQKHKQIKGLILNK